MDLYFDINDRIRIKIVATIYKKVELGSKKLIKRQFEYDLDRISGGPRSNRISLDEGERIVESARCHF